MLSTDSSSYETARSGGHHWVSTTGIRTANIRAARGPLSA